MTIAENKVVTLHYKLTDNDGTIIDQSDDGSFLYLHGAQNIIPGLENALIGKTSGDEFSVSVSPEEGYGERDDSRVASVPRDRFPADGEIEPGMQFHAQSPEGEMNVVTVTEVSDDTVTVDSNQQAVAVGVRDFGMGIAADDAARVFDRFWRADPSRKRTLGGTGLGLAISLGDAKLHGGELAVWSEPGRGAHFVLTLPRGAHRAGSAALPLDSPIPLDPGDENTLDAFEHTQPISTIPRGDRAAGGQS